ncbi:MAG TPA: nickel-binding protein [Alphaproteobacteria bacterium]|nr:nickel-binding protein [Alphaproteobacteria bacterium]
MMRRFVIGRAFPVIGSADRKALEAAAAKSHGTLHALGSDIQWIGVYAAADDSCCVNLAERRDVIRRHAERNGFPASRITGIPKVIDPTTANG